MIRVDGKPIYKKSGFKCLRSLVSVYPGYLGGTLLKCTRWLLKLDTHTTMNTFFPFFSGKCRQIIADALNGSSQGTLKGCTSDWVTMNSWILSFSSTGTSFRPHMHGEKLFRGIGSFSSAGSRPWDMEGGGGAGGVGRSYRPCDKRRGGVSKLFFRPFGPYFGLKLRGGRAPPGPSPGSANVLPAKST